jgi:hypothetical protein
METLIRLYLTTATWFLVSIFLVSHLSLPLYLLAAAVPPPPSRTTQHRRYCSWVKLLLIFKTAIFNFTIKIPTLNPCYEMNRGDADARTEHFWASL